MSGDSRGAATLGLDLGSFRGTEPWERPVPGARLRSAGDLVAASAAGLAVMVALSLYDEAFAVWLRANAGAIGTSALWGLAASLAAVLATAFLVARPAGTSLRLTCAYGATLASTGTALVKGLKTLLGRAAPERVYDAVFPVPFSAWYQKGSFGAFADKASLSSPDGWIVMGVMVCAVIAALAATPAARLGWRRLAMPLLFAGAALGTLFIAGFEAASGRAWSTDAFASVLGAGLWSRALYRYAPKALTVWTHMRHGLWASACALLVVATLTVVPRQAFTPLVASLVSLGSLGFAVAAGAMALKTGRS